MAYAAIADISPGRIPALTLAQLTSESKPPVTDVTVIQQKLDEASGQVELYCRERYALPLQPTVELVGITSAITIYLLYSRKPGPVPEQVNTNYSDALRLLRDISTGKASLDQPIGLIDQAGSGEVIVSRTHNDRRNRPFSNRNMQGYF